MRRVLWTLLLICFTTSTALAANTKAQLLLSADTARPGDSIMAAVRLKMSPLWHTYWRNPGESGIATSIEWSLPEGISAGPIQWPVPEKLELAGTVTYGYESQAVLLVPLQIATNAKPGPLALRANVSWLECQEQCIPGGQDVQANLEIGSEPKASSDAALIEAAKSKLPKPAGDLKARAWWEKPQGNTRSLLIEWPSTAAATNADFFPYEAEGFTIKPGVELVATEPGKIRLRKTVQKLEGDWPQAVSGLIVENVSEGQSATAREISFPLAVRQTGAQPVAFMLLYAFLGGLILNIMPCVLPVIALKILGFVQQSREHPATVKRLGLVYGFGVLFSFLILAGIVIAVQKAGHAAGWGMQFQNPQFLIVMTTLVTLVALNLFGVFEVNLGGQTMDAAATLASKQGNAGAFFNGVLATALATPCTAPFLAVALGFAFAQSAAMIVLMFLVMGAGLALPYVLLTWMPQLLRFLPKPGMWMEKFKIAMGFPMLGTAIWLLSLTSAHFGNRGPLWCGMFLAIVAFAAWIWGTFIQRGSAQRKGLAIAISLVLVVGGYAYALEKELNWRSPPAQIAPGSLKESADGIDWQPWSTEAVEKARRDGHPVLVDFTADWCVTCQANKKTSLEIQSVRRKLKDINAVALLGDYTRTDDAITAELKKFGRAGVPLVIVYPRNPASEPIVLPNILTPGIVLEALDKAAK